ncbi:MAG TPA: hypothetical protein VGF69_17535 [Thermoanaerobaculia bacterium]|jgi:hypothetical protein
MKLKKLIIATAIALLPLAASAAVTNLIVVPAAGTGPGANGSRWQTELTIHNTGSSQADLLLTFHSQTGGTSPKLLTVPARATVTLQDVVRTFFGKEVATGGILIGVPNEKRLAITSRTFNLSPAGEFGQDIPSFRGSEFATDGDVAILSGPSSVNDTRFNFGLFAVDATVVQWELLRADGEIGARKEVTYAAGQHAQYNSGVQTFLGVTPEDTDTIYARVISGNAVFYGSAINQLSNDPTFIPGIRTREQIFINFQGIDLDENGTVDIADADNDGTLDEAITLQTSTFPAFLRVVALGENSEGVTLQIVSSSADALIAGDTLQIAPTGELKGKTGSIVLRATAGGSSSLLTIPLKFQ